MSELLGIVRFEFHEGKVDGFSVCALEGADPCHGFDPRGAPGEPRKRFGASAGDQPRLFMPYLSLWRVPTVRRGL